MVNTNHSNSFGSSKYFVFNKQGLDRMYFGVAGREISLLNATFYLTHKEAQHHADNLNSRISNQKETSNES